MPNRKAMKVTRREACDMFDISNPLITRYIKKGGVWDGAVDGKLINVAHPKVVAWALAYSKFFHLKRRGQTIRC